MQKYHVYFSRLIQFARPLALCLILGFNLPLLAQANNNNETLFKRVPAQYIAALGDPEAKFGDGAQHWGIWQVDPGPRAVWIKHFDKITSNDGIAPANWHFDQSDWWLDENGLIMEKPDFPISPGKYVVTGGREAVSILTIHEADTDGNRRWELNDDATLYDVTHLRCRSARYRSDNVSNSCSPDSAQVTSFPVEPGGIMPAVQGCQKQDYTVLIVIGLPAESN